MFTMIPRFSSDKGRSMNLWNDRFFDNFFRFPSMFSPGAFRLDVKEDKDAYELIVELPGMKQEDLEITAHNGVLTIAAHMNKKNEDQKDNYIYCERQSGTYQRSLKIEGIREEAITARYEDGLLKVNLPKLAQEELIDAPRRIAIEAAPDEA